MKRKVFRKYYNYITIALLVLSFAGCTAWYFYSNSHAKNIQKRFSLQAEHIYNNIERLGGKFVFVDDSLIAWSDNNIPFNEQEKALNGGEDNTKIIAELKNGIYLHKSVKHNDTAIHYLYLIKHKYAVTNQYLDNSFNPPFDLDSETDIVTYQTDIPVVFNGNKTIAYIEASPECLKASNQDAFIFRLWAVINIFLLTIFILNTKKVNLFFALTFRPTASGTLPDDFGNTSRRLRERIKTAFKKNTLWKKIVVLTVLYGIYAVLTVFLCFKTDIMAFRLFSSDVNYNNILFFIIITLSGFVLYSITEKILQINHRKKYYFVKQFCIIWVISIIAGIITETYIWNNNKENIETTAYRLLKEDNGSNMKNFQLLMSNAVKDSAVLGRIYAKEYTAAEQYINKYYLSLLKENNHTNVLVFTQDDSMIVQPDNRYVNILSYVNTRKENADKIVLTANDSVSADNGFYVNNENSDNASYMFFNRGKGFFIFAECLQKENSQNMNYSLLLENGTPKTDIAYAKYVNNVLVYSYGDKEFLNKISPRSNGFEKNQNSHIYYASEGKITYVASSDNFSPYDILSSVSMFFLLMIFMLGTEHLIISIPHFRKKTLSIKSKILASLLGSFIISLILLGFFSMRSTLNLNNQNNISILKEKTESIKLEIEKYLALNDSITENDLIGLSNTFLTDINIFDIKGNLNGTSQPEIFEKGILSDKINPVALDMLENGSISLFYQKERIGKSEFLASYAYIQYPGSGNQYILNIPFINQQKIMNENIKGLINNFANMLLFWINIAVLIFVFLSNLISKPLELVKEKMGKINIDAENDKIVWKKNDEMGDLIKSYNMMIDKIEESSLLLKTQQRQASWRELAKQVAHDIKNPLTPMKLSIQYLQKIYNEKPEHFDEKFNEIAPSLISQIESISTITQELNSYSKPSVKKDKVDLNVCISTAINLFNNINDVEITYTPVENCFVTGEEKLFIRIFNNLIKNSMQALYNKEDGKIKIDIRNTQNQYIVSIEDNGCGIKEENKDKIFNNQFTTKSDGGGIGLTIVKSILESYDAAIDFKSKENIGTVFFITFNKTAVNKN